MQKQYVMSIAKKILPCVLFFFMLCLCACDNGEKSSASPANTPNTTAPAPAAPTQSTGAQENTSAQEPRYGGRLVMGSIGEPSNLIPYLSSDSASHEVGAWIYIAPLEYDKDLNIVPLAAETYQVSEDGKHYSFTLKEGLVWQDGIPLTADDVTFTYNLMVDPKTPTAYAADFMAIAEYKQTGPLSFEARFDEPYARAPITFMHAILPKHILEGQDIATTPFARNPIGAGPYKLKEWKSGSSITLEANPLYFKGRPYLDEIIWRMIPDLSTIFLEAKAGKLDFLGLTPQQYLRQTNGPEWDTKWAKYKYLASGYTYMGFNLANPLFTDEKVRVALSHAVDRKAIIASVLLGLGEVAIGPYKPGTWVYNTALEPYPFDPAKASALLAEAGWSQKNNKGILEKDGMPFSFTILVNQGNDERIKVATIIQSQLKDIGIECQIRTVEWAAFLKEFVDKGRFDAVILSWNILDDPDIFDVWHSSAAKENGLNFIGYKNPEVDSLLEKARILPKQEDRKPLYDRFQEILHKEQPYLFLYVPYSLPMVKKEYQNITPAPAGIMYNLPEWWIRAE